MIEVEDIEMWPVYVGLKHILDRNEELKARAYARMDLGIVFYPQIDAHVFVEPHGGLYSGAPVYNGSWWEPSANLWLDLGLGFRVNA